MPILKKGLLISASLLLGACSLFNVQDKVEDQSALENANTYRWKSEAIAKPDSLNSNQYLIDQHLRKSVNQIMTEKGYQLTQDSADLYVDYSYKLKPIVVAEQPEVSEASISFSRDTGITQSNADMGTSTTSLKAKFTIEILGNDQTSKAYSVTTDTKDLGHENIEDVYGHIDDLTSKMKKALPEK